jgi:hypothetical protein
MDLIEEGSPIEIKGKCAAACTIYLANPRTCVHKSARLLFQTVESPSDAVASGADWMLTYYPPKVREWIADQGGLQKKALILEGRDLARIVPVCGDSQTTGEPTVPKPKARPLRVSAAASTPVDKLETDEIVRRWSEADSNCRGGQGKESPAWCGVRAGYDELLSIRGWCFGKPDPSSFKPLWHKCSSQSQHRGLFE